MIKNKMVFILLFLGFLFTTLQSTTVSLSVTNREASSKTAEPITSGIPFAQGILTDSSKVKLLQDSTEIPTQRRTLATWPDGSIRWLLFDFQINLPASSSVSLSLQTGSTASSVTGISVNNQSATLEVNTGSTTFNFNKSELAIGSTYFQVTSGGTTYRAVPDSGGWSIEESGPLKTIVRVDGKWYNGSSMLGNSLIGFKARLIFFKNKSNVRALFTFKNNNAFGWYSSQGQSITLTSASFNTSLLSSGGTYVFGQGVEKTWELDVSASGSATKLESRYNASGVLASGYSAPHPLAVATPSYYASTGAFGQISLPISGASSSLQSDLDRFEKLQRAKVIPDDVENPTNLQGITLWSHLYQDINSWNDYGDLRWGGSEGPLSGNHYDWVYGMLLQYLRTGRLPFLDAARVFAKHEIDFDIYHTNADGNAFNYQKNWESRPSHNSADNTFGGGRPSHTWCQGYALYWLLTGDPRGKDAVDEIIEGLRQYVYESFNGNGYINTNEIRIQGWLTETLVTYWRINPSATFQTTEYGTKSIQQALKDVLDSVFDLESNAGSHGYIIDGDPPESNMSAPLYNCYFLEPAIKAYTEVFKNRDNAYATTLLGLIRRMTTWLMSVTYGGTTNGSGQYLPRQIPYHVNRNLSQQTEGQIPYLLMAANAAGFCYSETNETAYQSYMRSAFQDYIRYLGVEGGDTYLDPSRRTPTSFNSSVYVDTESKVHGWSSRYGQFYLAAENPGGGESPTISLNKTSLLFGAVSGNATQNQQVLLTGSGGTLTWTATPSASWIVVTPSSGTGNASLQIGVNPTGLAAGTHTGTISISDSHASNSPQTISVTLNYGSSSQFPFGAFETPTDNATVRSSIPITGWALDDVQVSSVKIMREPVAGEGEALVYIGDAVFVEGMRPDVAAAYNLYPLNERAGWGYMLLTYGLPDQGLSDTFRIHAIAYDAEGNSTDLGVKTILCDNSHASKPFGAIDTPVQGGIVSGSEYINWGWALTPQPNDIATNGSTIAVIIDGVNVGHPGYNVYREDISGMFPGYMNSAGPVGYFYLNALSYENGLHTIEWAVVDSAGNADGIGSRYFTVQNTGVGSSVPESVAIPSLQTLQSTPVQSRIPVDDGGPVWVTRGYSPFEEPEAVYPDSTGVITIEINEMERIRVQFSEDREDMENPETVMNEFALPVGSTLDRTGGLFYWLPGPGFVGDYALNFFKAGSDALKRIQIVVKIKQEQNQEQ
ncbi:MAG: hypothetical protein ACM3SY_11220 [Candidatus Omnitrophota bacterium]